MARSMILFGLLVSFALGALLIGLAVVLGMFSAFGGRLPAPRRLVAGSAIAGSVLLASALAGFSKLEALELRAVRPRLERIQERARPLVAAIERFEREQGRLLERLDELTPAYIEQIPETGEAPFAWRMHRGGVVGLVVEVPLGPTSSDSYVYSPERLPIESDGVTLRFGDWVYCRE